MVLLSSPVAVWLAEEALVRITNQFISLDLSGALSDDAGRGGSNDSGATGKLRLGAPSIENVGIGGCWRSTWVFICNWYCIRAIKYNIMTLWKIMGQCVCSCTLLSHSYCSHNVFSSSRQLFVLQAPNTPMYTSCSRSQIKLRVVNKAEHLL